jgi:hypothetical protein
LKTSCFTFTNRRGNYTLKISEEDQAKMNSIFIPLINLLFFGCLAVISGSYAWAFGARAHRFHVPSALVGIALAPALSAIAIYVGFAALAFIAPSRILFILLPVVASVAAAFLFGQRPARFLPPAKLGEAAVLMTILLFAAVPPINQISLRVAHIFTPHDLTTYFLQAIDLSGKMEIGAGSLFEWWNYQHPFVSQPHSLNFPMLLGWGFLFVDNPGYGADYLPKLIVAWTILSLITSCIAIGLAVGPAWSLATGVFILTNIGLTHQVSGLSRDSFYLAPFFALLVLTTRSAPSHWRIQTSLLFAQSLALIATVLGHSLGIIYASALLAAYGVVAAFKFGARIFLVPWLWLAGAILSICAFATYARYFLSNAASIGFQFPYYVDPFQRKILTDVSPFAVEASVAKLVQAVFGVNGIDPRWMLITAIAAIPVLWRFFRRRLLQTDMLWLLIALSIVFFLCMVSFLPIRLDGLSLASAFVVNFRYGLGLSLLIQLLIVLSASTITHQLLQIPRPTSARYAAGIVALFFAGAAYYGGNADWTVKSDGIDAVSLERDKACQIAKHRQPRRILIDDANMVYICSGKFTSAYSDAGVLITGVDGNENIKAALDAQEIDAVVLYDSPRLWSGTRLYHFLKANWQNPYNAPGHVEVFLRPSS